MKIMECNKIIAEFMGVHEIVLEEYPTDCYRCKICKGDLDKHDNMLPSVTNYRTKWPTYHDDLNALISPLKKLPFTLMICKTDCEWIAGEMMWRELTGRFEVRDESASKALAMSVVKAIQELNRSKQ